MDPTPPEETESVLPQDVVYAILGLLLRASTQKGFGPHAWMEIRKQKLH
ncbi:hypothetical protein [Tropicimonas sp. S265A]